MRVRPVACVLLLAFVGCETVDADWDLDSQADLASRSTFALEAVATEPTALSTASPEDWARRQNRVRILILSDLTAKGYRHHRGSPDFVVRYVAGVERSDGARSDGDGPLAGEIDIHAIDPTSGRWLWHGWATETWTARLDRDTQVRKAVTKILSKFPPASGD